MIGGFADGLGFAAGILVTASTLPKLAERIRTVARGGEPLSPGDLGRDALQAAGNILWVAAGASAGMYSVVFFCAVNAALLTALAVLNVRGASGRARSPHTREGA